MKRTWIPGEWIVKLWLIVKQVQPFLAHYCGLGNRFSMSHPYKLPILFCRVSILPPFAISETRFSAWRSAILSHGFHGYSQSLQNMFRVIYKVRELKIPYAWRRVTLPSVSTRYAIVKDRVYVAINSSAEAWKPGKLRTKIQFLRCWEDNPWLKNIKKQQLNFISVSNRSFALYIAISHMYSRHWSPYSDWTTPGHPRNHG